MNKTKIRATEQPIAVDIEGLSAMLSCGRATARKIGEQAGAKIVRVCKNPWKMVVCCLSTFIIVIG